MMVMRMCLVRAATSGLVWHMREVSWGRAVSQAWRGMVLANPCIAVVTSCATFFSCARGRGKRREGAGGGK